ncbi:MAG: hypothetical protein E7302_12870 [Butyrivibrio sp.]|nr:hypothetical protein [Butyrivibrio sp.]
MGRTRAYRRYVRNKAIIRKKRIWRDAFGCDWYLPDGKYAKARLGCNCWMCKPQKHYYIPTMFELRDADHVRQSLEDYYNS